MGEYANRARRQTKSSDRSHSFDLRTYPITHMSVQTRMSLRKYARELQSQTCQKVLNCDQFMQFR
jgi:hypothetical protein